MSKTQSQQCTKRNQRLPSPIGDEPGAPPSAPSSSPADAYYPNTTHPGSITGASSSTTYSTAPLEAYAACCLGIGGTELPAAERAGHTLLERSPLRETGYALLMDALAAQGNTAQAMQIYDRARSTLHEELGITPGRTIQQAHARLLGITSTPP